MRKVLYTLYYLLTAVCIIFLTAYFTDHQLLISNNATGIIGAASGIGNFILAIMITILKNKKETTDGIEFDENTSSMITIEKEREDLMKIPEQEEEAEQKEIIVSESKRKLADKIKNLFLEQEENDEEKINEITNETVSEQKIEPLSQLNQVNNLNIANTAYTAVNGENSNEKQNLNFDYSEFNNYVEPLSSIQKEYIEKSDDSYLNTIGLPQLRITTNLDNRIINRNQVNEIVAEKENHNNPIQDKAIVYDNTSNENDEDDYANIEKLEKIEDILNVAIPVLVVLLFILGIYLLYGKLFG